MQGGNYQIRNKKLLYPELSFKINGALMEVSKQLGGGHKEVYYQKALAKEFDSIGIKFKEQFYACS